MEGLVFLASMTREVIEGVVTVRGMRYSFSVLVRGSYSDRGNNKEIRKKKA